MKILTAGKTLERIPYAQKPLDKDTPITFLSRQDFEKKMGFEYDESLYIEDDIYLPGIDITISPTNEKPTEQQIAERLQTPLEGLVVCQMHDPAGHGLFTQKFIPKGTVIGFEFGKLGDLSPLDHYATKVPSKTNALLAVSSKTRGGLMRFMQHLPFDEKRFIAERKQEVLRETAARLNLSASDLKQMLDQKNISSDEVEKIVRDGLNNDPEELKRIKFINMQAYQELAFANISAARVLYNSTILIVFFATFDIPAYSQIGNDYGSADLLTGRALYFDIRGKILTPPDVKYLVSKDNEEDYKVAKRNYSAGILDYQAKKYEDAEAKILQAKYTFIQIVSCYSEENAEATSTLGSIYREQNKIFLAIEAVAQAIMIIETIKQNPAKTYEKLNTCLSKVTESSNELNDLATYFIKQGHYLLAQKILFTIFEKLPSNCIEKPVCAYNIASCYRHLNQLNEGNQYDQMAKDMPNCPNYLREKINARLNVQPSNNNDVKKIVKSYK